MKILPFLETVGVLLLQAALLQPVCPAAAQSVASSRKETVARDTLKAGLVVGRAAMTGLSVPARRSGSEQFRRSGALAIDEIIKGWAGVSVRDYGGIGGFKTVSVRGLGAQHTVVCRDGAVIGDACNGQVDISAFNLDGIEELSMNLGVADDIFVPARTALAAGIINIKSAAPLLANGPVEASLRATAASFGSRDIALRLGTSLGKDWSASIYGTTLSSDGDYPYSIANAAGQYKGKRDGADCRRIRGELRLRGTLGKRSRLELGISGYGSDRGLPGAVILYADAAEGRLEDKMLNINGMWENDRESIWRVRTTAAYNRTANVYTDFSPLYPEAQTDHYLQEETSCGLNVMRQLLGAWSFGLAQDLIFNSLQSDIPFCPQPRRLSSYTCASALMQTDKLVLTALLQCVAIGERTEGGEAAEGRFRLSPSLSIAWEVLEGLTLRASCRDGYRVPTFNDLYYDRVGTRTLKSEKALQTNLGIGYESRIRSVILRASADIYHYEVKDKIVAVPTMFVWKMRNLGRVRMTGCEMNVSSNAKLGKSMIYANISGTYQRAVDISDPSAKNYGHQIQYTPALSGNLNFGWELAGGLGASYSLQAVGKRYYLAQNLPQNALKAYFDHGINLHKSFLVRKTGLDFSISALNLSGKNYEIIHGYPMPGRNYRITIKINI